MSKTFDFKERLSSDIREAFVLLKERTNYKHGDVNLNDAIIITGPFSDTTDETEVLGFEVYICDTKSSFDYFICIKDPSKTEEEFLKCHVQAMENNCENL